MSITRNEFLKVLGLSATATLTSISGFSAQPKSIDHSINMSSALKLGLASYTLRKFSLEEVIKISQRLGLSSVALKSMHMPLESSADDIKKMAAKIRSAGLGLYGAGVIYMKTAQEVESAFNYAANAGLEMIIGVPNHDLLPLVNEKVKKHNIKVAIHNHGPGDDLYSSPDDVFAQIKSLDKRIGLCIDIGHVKRIGQDPVAMIEKYKDRLYDMHMKDVNKAEAEGTPVEIGRGIIDIPNVIKTLKKINYQGYVAFEYEKDGDDPVIGLAESVGYVRGIEKMA
ncbi:MAG: sugar phosphate isomerase/epimerase [Cyclobacteriaceae bacterium]